MRLGADSHHGGVVMMGHVHPIAVVGGLFPALGFAAGFADTPEGMPLHGGRRGDTGKVEHERGEIDVLNNGIGTDTGLGSFGIAHDKRHAHRGIVGPAFVLIIIFAQPETLVTGVYDHGVVVESLGLEIIEEPFEIIVHAFHAAEVFAQVGLIGEMCGLALGELDDVVVGGKFFGETFL